MTNCFCAPQGFHMMDLRDCASDKRLATQMVDWYRAVFNAQGKGEFGENWTEEEAHERIFGRVTDPGHGAAFIENEGRITGASLFQVGSFDEVYVEGELPSTLRGSDHQDTVRRHLEWFTGTKATLLYYRELGIRKERRGNLMELLSLFTAPFNCEMAKDADFSFLRTTKKSRLFPLMQDFDLRVVVDCRDAGEYVIMGDHLCTGCRRFLVPYPVLLEILRDRARMRLRK